MTSKKAMPAARNIFSNAMHHRLLGDHAAEDAQRAAAPRRAGVVARARQSAACSALRRCGDLGPAGGEVRGEGRRAPHAA